MNLPGDNMRESQETAMSSRDPRVDDYIADSAEFARPILEHLRTLVHANCRSVEETIKWGFPNFVHAHQILCHMAAFKQHVAFGFWKAALLEGIGPVDAGRKAMGQFGRLRSMDDLPSERLLGGFVRQAMKLNEDGVKRPSASIHPADRALAMPAQLAAELAQNPKARANFERFPCGQQREYQTWIAQAKRSETRARRVAQAIEWIAEGKRRNWRYLPAS